MYKFVLWLQLLTNYKIVFNIQCFIYYHFVLEWKENKKFQCSIIIELRKQIIIAYQYETLALLLSLITNENFYNSVILFILLVRNKTEKQFSNK